MSAAEDVCEPVNGKRSWLTAAEFRALIEAHRVACLPKPRVPRKPFEPGPYVREYELDFDLKYVRRPRPRAILKLEAES